MIDFLATLPHYRDHMAPVRDALPEGLRGRWYGPDDDVPPGGPVLVASYHDVLRARRAGRRIARMEHGAGQSYGGTEATARHPAYPGGDDHDDVGLFLVPGSHPAGRWQARYPQATVVEIGSPRLALLPKLEPQPEPVVALSFHFNAHIGADEANSAWRHYQDVLPSLRGFRVIGHCHPRHGLRIRRWFERAQVPFVERFDDVCRMASVYVCDNSSTLFEFASTGRPVVVLNAPWYRAEHGLRFWDSAGVGVNVSRPEELAAAVDLALADGPQLRSARRAAVRRVYTRTAGTERAARYLTEWAA